MSRAIRILLLGDARQVHIVRWANFLAESGFEVLTVSLESVDGVPTSRQRIRISERLPHFVRYPMAVVPLRRIACRFAPDLVNAHFLPNYGVMAALLGSRPWILSTWGSDIMLLPERNIFQMARTRWVLDRATVVTSDADVMSRRLEQLGVDPGSIVTFPYGVDRRTFFPGDPPPETIGPRVVSNRKLESVYDIETVIDGFADVTEGLTDAQLTVAGDGSLRDSLARRAADGAASGRIRFIGDIAHGDMPDLLRGHDIYVSIARSDTTSVSLLEAMACGLFPVVGDIPANREWVSDGCNGLLVPVGDRRALAEAIARAWSDPPLRERVREANLRVIAERADWFDNMEKLRSLVERLARGEGSGEEA